MVNCKIKLLWAGKSRWPGYFNGKVEGLCETRAWGCCEGFPVLSASRKAAEGKASASWASSCFLPLTLTEQVYTHYREFGSLSSSFYSVTFSWVPGLFRETMKCLVVKAKPWNNSVVARMAEEYLKRCPIPLSGWGACRRSPEQQTAGPYWNSFWFIDVFLQVWFFSFIHYKVNFLCTHVIVLYHLLVIVWTVTTVYMALAFVPTIPCPCSASQSAGVSNCFWGWDVCEGGSWSNSTIPGLWARHVPKVESLVPMDTYFFLYFLSKVGNFSLLLYLWII